MSRLFQNKTITRFWVDAEFLAEKSSWRNGPAEETCLYWQEYIAKAAQLNLKMGIVASVDDWMHAFEDRSACPEISNVPLWWWKLDTETEYQQFGGWKTPYMELTSSINLCSQDINVNKIN